MCYSAPFKQLHFREATSTFNLEKIVYSLKTSGHILMQFLHGNLSHLVV